MDTADQIRTTLDGRWGHVRQQARATLDPAVFAPDLDHKSLDDAREATLQAVLDLTKTSFARDGLTQAQGGTNDHGASVTAFEMLGHLDLSIFVKAGVQFGLFGGAIANLGTERHHREYLPGMLDGSLLGSYAMTETGHGSDVQSLLTTATYIPETDEIEIHTPSLRARKDYIGNAARDGRMATVFAQLIVNGESQGVHCVLVPIRSADGTAETGVTIEDCGYKMGLRGVDNGRLTFDRVRVPRANLLNRYGDITDEGVYTSPIESQSRRFFTMLGTLVRGRVSVGGGAGAATRTSLALAIDYGLHRTQFHTPDESREVTILDYQGHQRKLLPRLAKSYGLLLAQNALVEQMHRIAAGEESSEDAQRELEARAAGLKALTTEHATQTIQACREACGGAGYLSANRFGGLKADTDVFTTFEGDNTVLFQLVAKGMLTNYSAAFHELDTRGAFFFGARQVTDAVIERTVGSGLIQRLINAAPGRDAEQAIDDRGEHLDLFEDREKHLLETLAQRLRAANSDDADAFAVFNGAQHHLLLTARAHIERVVLEAFVAAIDDTPEGEARDLLEKVCDLYVASNLEADRGWFLEHARLSDAQSKALIRKVDRLCAELRPHARTLIDAFGIPEGWLQSELLEFASQD